MLQNAETVRTRNRRVVNGMTVRESWDWIVRLEFLTDKSDMAFLCGGTVIHRNFVLTAAHCCIDRDYVVMTFKANIRNNRSIKIRLALYFCASNEYILPRINLDVPRIWMSFN